MKVSFAGWWFWNTNDHEWEPSVGPQGGYNPAYWHYGFKRPKRPGPTVIIHALNDGSV